MWDESQILLHITTAYTIQVHNYQADHFSLYGIFRLEGYIIGGFLEL